jgi:hypothetical protein
MASAKSILGVIGSDAERVLTFLASKQGLTVVKDGETLAEDVDPALTGFVTIINIGLDEVFKMQAIASKSGATNADELKAAAVIATLTPILLAYAKQHNFPVPTPAEIKTVNDGLVMIADAIRAKA